MNPTQSRIAARLPKPHRRKIVLWIAAALLLSIVIGASLIQRAPQHHAYVVVQAHESLRITFLKQVHHSVDRCRATADSVAKTMLAQCANCRLVESRCLDQLDARQRKILSGQALDVPVMRIPGGAVAFTSGSPGLADQTCRESERQTPGNLQAQCDTAGPHGIALSIAKISGETEASLMPKFDAMMWLVLLAATISLLVCYLIIRSEHLHGRYSHDLATAGPQKFHSTPTPRIGGIAIAAGLWGSIIALERLDWLNPISASGLAMLALSAVPAFAGGFGEDVTKKVGVLARLMLTFAAGVFASVLVGATLDRLDVPGLDAMLQQWPIFAIAFTAFAVGGIANSINIIDGYNGLAGGYSVIVLAALAWVASQVGDPVVLTASLAMLGALLGFLVWNYPKGRIFLGDGGAYLLGFWLAELSVLLIVRNPDVSPWFSLVLLAYPVFETLFSIYRKTFLRGHSPGQPDGLHLHMLIYKRLARIGVSPRTHKKTTRRNSMVAIYVWAGIAPFVLPSLFVWRSTAWLVALAFIFAAAYTWLYFRLTRWRAPAWMIISPKTRES